MSIENVGAVSKSLEGLDPVALMAWAGTHFLLEQILVSVSGKRKTLLSVTREGLNLIGEKKRFQAAFVNTQLYKDDSPFTLQYIAQLADEGNTEGYILNTYKSETTPEELDGSLPGWRSYGSAEHEEAKQILKVQPLQRAFAEQGTALWVTGARREQPGRENLPILDQREEDGIYVLYALASLSLADIEEHDRAHNLAANHLYRDYFRGSDQQVECGLLTYRRK